MKRKEASIKLGFSRVLIQKAKGLQKASPTTIESIKKAKKAVRKRRIERRNQEGFTEFLPREGKTEANFNTRRRRRWKRRRRGGFRWPAARARSDENIPAGTKLEIATPKPSQPIGKKVKKKKKPVKNLQARTQ